MDAVTQANRDAWEAASRKHVREYDDLLAQAAASLNAVERGFLADILDGAPEVVHLQSGHGLEDAALVQTGAKSVIGVDYSGTAAGSAQQRAGELGCRAGTSSARCPLSRSRTRSRISSTRARAR